MKYSVLLASLIVALSLTACGKKEEAKPATDATTATVPADATKTAVDAVKAIDPKAGAAIESAKATADAVKAIDPNAVATDATKKALDAVKVIDPNTATAIDATKAAADAMKAMNPMAGKPAEEKKQ